MNSNEHFSLSAFTEYNKTCLHMFSNINIFNRLIYH